MKRSLLVIFGGLLCGVLAHVGWFTAHRPPAADNLAAQLAWMQESLQLTPEQFARIKELHEESSPRLQALATQVAQMRSEFAAFERARQTEGQVDFLEFARFVEHQRAVDRECLESTQKLVLAASEVMDARQRERYLAIIDPGHRVNLKGSLN